MKRIKICHISHTDLDGVMPIIFTKAILNLLDEDWLKATNPEISCIQIEPKNLGETLDKIYPIVDDFDLIIITDLNISKENLCNIINNIPTKKLLICDHHQTNYGPKDIAIWYADKYPEETTGPESCIMISPMEIISSSSNPAFNLVFKESEYPTEGYVAYRKASGTSIYQKHGIDQVMKNLGVTFDASDICHVKKAIAKIVELAEAVRLYDTYEWKESPNMPNSITAKGLHDLHIILGQEGFKKIILDYIDNDTYDPYSFIINYLIEVYPIIYHLLLDKQKEDEEYIEKKIALSQIGVWVLLTGVRKDGSEYTRNMKAIVSIGERCISEIGNNALMQYPDCDIAIIFNGFDMCSLRSIDDKVHCDDFARAYGGGGHIRAAGFPVPNGSKIRSVLLHLLGLPEIKKEHISLVK